ncbi:MAG TPA: tRNA pseudouridine(55) synthase TruB, partial [Candidatus Deferrimicrobium sp.]|nr:tRNA pseudouridine(55) synthase TruB [Candidatus Deferrimicrobium sp.]
MLVVDKPPGITSFDAVRAVGRILKERKCGHAGTLDPMATGVLPVCVGAATKIAGYLTEEEKEYEATFAFGVATDTGDATGKPVEERPGATATEGAVAEALADLVGTFEQVPPAYSAVKVGGVRSYTLARKGMEVPLAARRVTVREARLLSIGPERFRVFLAVSKGFYVRSLPRDLGARLGVPLTVSELRRTRVGPFRAELAVTLDALRERARGVDAVSLLIPIVDALGRFPHWEVPAEAVSQVRNGRLSGPWLVERAAAEPGDLALLVT